MPMPGFLSSIADKAQSAINASPLAGHIPTSSHHARPSSPDPAPQPSANAAAGQGGAKSHTLEALQYQFRTIQQQYSTTTPVQKIITSEKGLSMDFDNVSRDSKAQSKELYTWGQTEAEDLKDVTDRLAYLNFVQGSLASSLAAKLESARAPLKALRDAETGLQPRRNIRAGIQTQIGRFEHESQKANDRRVADLREQLRKAELEDQQQEREIELLKRKAIRESEQIKWDAIREYGEKLVLLSQAAPSIIAVLPSIPPGQGSPYTGGQTTGAVRASLQRALDNYKTGHINLPPQASAADLSRSDTVSFGESHASELSSINSAASSSHSAVNSPSLGATHKPAPAPAPVPIPASATPVAHTKPLPSGPESASSPHSPPINPYTLNQAPAPIPQATVTPPAASPHADPSKAAAAPHPIITPTIAETGVPVSAGPDGPGPASGSLRDVHAASSDAGPRSGGLPAGTAPAPEYGQSTPDAGPYTTPAPGYGQSNPVGGFVAPGPKHESAEDEKKRLAAMYSQQSAATNAASSAAPTSMPAPATSASSSAPPPAAAASQPVHHESAEEEKKRLEREERERILHGGSSHPPGAPKDNRPDEDLPPYQEPGL